MIYPSVIAPPLRTLVKVMLGAVSGQQSVWEDEERDRPVQGLGRRLSADPRLKKFNKADLYGAGRRIPAFPAYSLN
jgi:hypothetical protein